VRKSGNPNWKKGINSPNPGGRPKGLRNKITIIKEAICDAFDRKSFRKWAKENETDFYNLMIKTMPKELEITGQDGNPIELIDWKKISTKDLKDLAKLVRGRPKS
jgi:hypothetical protein